MPLTTEEEHLIGVIKGDKESIAQIANANLTLIGIGAGALLIRSEYSQFIPNIGVSFFAVFLSVFSLFYTKNVATIFEYCSECINKLPKTVAQNVVPAGMDGNTILKLAKEVRFSAAGVFGASFIILNVTWLQYLVTTIL